MFAVKKLLTFAMQLWYDNRDGTQRPGTCTIYNGFFATMFFNISIFYHFMQRRVFCAFACVALCCLCAPLQGQVAAPGIVPTTPDALRFGDTVMAPLPPLIDLLELSISPTGESQWRVARAQRSFSFSLGEAAALANDRTLTLPATPFTRADVAYLPLVALIHALGGRCTEQQAGQAMHITLPGMRRALVLAIVDQGTDYSWFRDDNAELFAIRLDGGGLRRLTYNRSEDHAPIFSPDGKDLLYLRDDALFLRPITAPDGRHLLRPYPDKKRIYTSLAFTPNGKEILFVQEDRGGAPGDAQHRIGLIGRDGAHRRLLADGHAPALSPDGTMLVYGYREPGKATQLRMMALREKKETLLIDGDMPLWHPQLSWLYFQRRYCDMANARGGEMPVNSLLTGYALGKNRQPHRLHEPTGGLETGDELEACLSRDGKTIVFRKDGHGLFLLNADLTNRRKITGNPADHSAVFCPDGRLIFLRNNVLMLVDPETRHESVLYGDRPVRNFSVTPDGLSVIFSALPEEKSFTLFLG